MNKMEDELKLTYFFDDIVNFVRVANEIFDLYSEYIIKSKFMHAEIKDNVFEEKGPKEDFENMMKVMRGEEITTTDPGKSIKLILSLSLEKNAPVEEIDNCLWINGGWIGDYDDNWYQVNAVEDVTYVSDRNKVVDEYKHHMRTMLKISEE